MWIDTHAHLADLSDAELDGRIERARVAGIARIVNTATSMGDALTVIRQCVGNPVLAAAVGISPFDVMGLAVGWDIAFTQLFRQPAVIAIGEVGLDGSNPRYPPLASQIPVFERFCELSIQTGLPLVVHSRGAEERVIDVCRTFSIQRAVFHCFTGSISALREILDNGWHVSFSGIITFPRNNCADAVRYTPMDRLLIETDSPYLAPVPMRGTPNEPALVRLVGEALAAIKNIAPAALAEQIGRTFGAIFR
jgi:TatD DNase family protein